jgi:hypothetical protein
VNKDLLVPNFINQKEEKMEETTPVVTEEKTLLQKIWNKISNESETPSVENEVDNEVTPEEQTAIVDEVMQLLEPRIVALEEAMAEMMPKEEEEAEEEPMEEEMVEDKKENLSEVIKNEIAEAFKNFVEPTPTKSNKTNSANDPTWKKHLDNFQNFIK